MVANALRFAFLKLCCGILCLCVSGMATFASAEEPDVIDPAKHPTARVVAVNDHWALWVVSKNLTPTPRPRWSLFEHRYYRQKLGESMARFALVERNSSYPGPALLMQEDGVLLTIVNNHDRFAWCELDGTIDVGDKYVSNIVKRYVDGLIVQEDLPGFGPDVPAGRATWIPCKDRKLDFDNQVEIVPRGEKVFGHSEPARCGDVLVWLDEEKIHCFNLKTKERTITPIEKRHKGFGLKNSEATGFDGTYVIVGSVLVVNAKTGERVVSAWGGNDIRGIFVTKGPFAYQWYEGIVSVIDLREEDPKPKKLADVGTDKQFSNWMTVFPNQDGILYWDNDQWQTIDWVSDKP